MPPFARRDDAAVQHGAWSKARHAVLSALTRHRLPHEPAEKPLAAVLAKHHSRSCGDSATTAIGPVIWGRRGPGAPRVPPLPPPTEVEAAGSIRECGRGGLSPWDVWHAGKPPSGDLRVWLGPSCWFTWMLLLLVLCALQQSRFFQFRENFYVFHRYPSRAPRHCRSSVDQCSVNTVPFTWALSLSSSQHPGGEESDRQERDHEPEGIKEPERLGQEADHGWAAEVC